MNRYDVLLKKSPEETEVGEFVPVPVNKDWNIKIHEGNPWVDLEYLKMFEKDFNYERFICGSLSHGTGRRIGREVIGGEDPIGITRSYIDRMIHDGSIVREIVSAPGIFVRENDRHDGPRGRVASLSGIPIVVCDKIPSGTILIMPNRDFLTGATLIKLGYSGFSGHNSEQEVSGYSGFSGVSGVAPTGVSGFSGATRFDNQFDDQYDALDLMARTINVIRGQTGQPMLRSEIRAIGNAHNFSIETADSAGLDRFGTLFSLVRRRTEEEQESDDSFRERLLLYITGGK